MLSGVPFFVDKELKYIVYPPILYEVHMSHSKEAKKRNYITE